MSFRKINYGDELDAGKDDWQSASNGTMSEEDSAAFNARITPRAFQRLLVHPQTIKFLLPVIHQMFCHTSISVYNEKTECFDRMNDKKKRQKYALYFEATKACMRDNELIRKDLIAGTAPVDINSFVNLSLIFAKLGTVSGYFSYYRHRDPEILGTETMFLYFNKSLRKCCYAITPYNSDVTMHALTVLFSKESVFLPFDKICASCGRCSHDLMYCKNCKVTQYCNTDCQNSHWHEGHKRICRIRQAKLDKQTQKLHKLDPDSERIKKTMSAWKSLCSSPEKPEAEPTVAEAISRLSELSMVALEGEPYQRVRGWPEDDDEKSVKSDAASVDSVDSVD